jgi:hypothetical protein
MYVKKSSGPDDQASGKMPKGSLAPEKEGPKGMVQLTEDMLVKI